MANTSFSSKTYTYRTINSAPIQVDTWWQPAAWDVVQSHRTLINFHGGGLVSGNRAARFPGLSHQLLLQQGWLILSADYRLLPESDIADVMDDALHLEEWVLQEGKQLGMDLGQVAVGGSSAGVFVAILALSVWEKLRPRALYSLYGMLDLSNPWYSTPKSGETLFLGIPGHLFEEKNVAHYLTSGNPPIWDDKTDFMDPSGRSAFFVWLLREGKVGEMVLRSFKSATGKEQLFDLVTSSFPQTVAMHGTKDSITPQTDSEKLLGALARHGVPGHMVTIEGADHGANPQENFVKDFEECTRLLNKCMDQ